MANIGILVHGRNVHAEEWETLMMGNPPEKLGSLTRLVLEILNRGPENVGLIVFGTGASERDEIKEAFCMRNYLVENFDCIEEFSAIKDHPRMQTEQDIRQLTNSIKNIYCETFSKNTAEEIKNAAALFEKKGCTEIYQISCGSHMARCTQEMLKARDRGDIPTHQRWYSAPDDMAYANSEIGDVVVLEPPHRSDDPMLKADVRMTTVVRGLFGLTPVNRIACLQEVEHLIEGYME